MNQWPYRARGVLHKEQRHVDREACNRLAAAQGAP